jgi:hypothetical protein
MQPYANSLHTSICHDGSQMSEPVEEADQCANLSEHHELHALQTGRSGPRGKTIMLQEDVDEAFWNIEDRE